jgi:nitroimidazol reductase NimA-like FMN-containing flavoprotein (pyridoxamine 5'-phosphate oxidase superfamily)
MSLNQRTFSIRTLYEFTIRSKVVIRTINSLKYVRSINARVQCEHVLNCELVGRIGCAAADKVYIIPVTYVFHDKFIYAHSKEGLKVRMMRKNPKVCFEVESRESMRDWRSVILWGRYEELKSVSEQKKAL